MNEDLQERLRSWLHRDAQAHPQSPGGGAGPGFSRTAGPINYPGTNSILPHTDSPVGRHFDWQAGVSRVERETVGFAGRRKDISIDDGRRIVSEAASWKGTPYRLNGPRAIKGVGGDCSGTTYKIYLAAQCPYTYQTAHGFPAYALKSGLFRELGAGEQRRDGDILSWPNHMAIFSSFALDPDNASRQRTNKYGQKWTQTNDMWTASMQGGPPYAPAELRFWRPDAPKLFRYLK